jgi:transmembrane sensor
MTHDEAPKNDSTTATNKDGWDVDAMWARVRARTVDAAAGSLPDSRPALASVPRGRRTRFVAYAAYAAALAIVAGAATVVLRPSGDSETASAPPGQYRTSRGQHATVSLSDGTKVSLAPESRLTISPRFADGVREIILDGEAAFTVRHDAAHPFRVRARGALIEDVGTRFDLRAYAGDAAVTVAVIEGSVTIRAARPDSAPGAGVRAPVIVLDSGEVGTIDMHGAASGKHIAAASRYFDWTRGRLSFVDRPLPEVLRTVARWYDLEVHAPDARLASRRVTAEFSADSGTGAIDALALAMDAVVHRDGRILTLTPR